MTKLDDYRSDLVFGIFDFSAPLERLVCELQLAMICHFRGIYLALPGTFYVSFEAFV